MPFVIEWVDHCDTPEQVSHISTPGGLLLVHHRGDVICGTDWSLDTTEWSLLAETDTNPLSKQINQYCSKPEQNYRIKLLLQGSVYRHKVWQALCEIPFGSTTTYSAIAKCIQSAPRAIGNACRDNPYAFFIPCHRVVSVSGIGGYNGQTSGSLVTIKQKLLAFEVTSLAAGDCV